MAYPFLIACLIAGIVLAICGIANVKAFVDPPKWSFFLLWFPAMMRIFFEPDILRLVIMGMGISMAIASGFVLLTS
jgi:hypothetical protein